MLRLRLCGRELFARCGVKGYYGLVCRRFAFRAFQCGHYACESKIQAGRLADFGNEGRGRRAHIFARRAVCSVPEKPFILVVDCCGGAAFGVFSSRLYSASAKFGAGATSRISMLAVPFGLVFWWIIDFAGFVELVKTPSVLLGILASVAAICFSFKKMSAGGGGSGAQTSYLLPAVAVLAVMMIVRKEAMAEADFASAAVYYPLCAIFISASINLGVYAYSNGAGMLAAQLRTHHVLAGGISMAVVSSLTIFTGNLASLYVPDPAYLSALTLTSPLWIMLYNACFGIRDVVEKRWVIAMLLSLCALMFFAQMPLSSPSEIPSTAGHRG